jgi:hypothetical protein
MKRPRNHRIPRGDTSRAQRQLVQEAARLLAHGEAGHIDEARQKAARRLGITSHWPVDNPAIEQALRDYRELFHKDAQAEQLRQLRREALHAMRLLAPFDPHLVGAVLSGALQPDAPVHLHLFADSAESVAIFLMDQNIYSELGERRVRYAAGQEDRLPVYRFMAGNTRLELTIFSAHGLRRRPLSPIDGRPMARANAVAVAQLLEEDAL